MKNFKNIYRKGAGSVCCGVAAALMALPMLTSCEDFFTQESSDVLYADQEHLNLSEDSIYSVTGVLTKLQTLADRTILLGELRGDLVDLTEVADKNLREILDFNVSDDNIYNNPSDYYAVINNCNYFIAKADTALRNNRGEFIFMKEYAAIKAIRAWTYLQLAINYGKVPFYTEPLLSKEEAEAAEKQPRADIQTICNYFINDLATLPERYNTELPGYRVIRGVESKLLYFPLSVVRGDLYLWLASQTQDPNDYKKAAENYYKYISERNGVNSAYPTTMAHVSWMAGSTAWTSYTYYSEVYRPSESIAENAELITMIAGDSIRAEGHYSELRNFFTSREENDYKVSINPSPRLIEISESQNNCVLTSRDGTSMTYSPKGLSDHMSGDLRLPMVYSESWMRDDTGKRIETQSIAKYSSSRNVHIYRRTMVYLRMAEALNAAGYPRMAFQILKEGLSNEAINDKVIHYTDSAKTLAVSLADSAYLAKFDFSDVRYGVIDAMEFARDEVSQGTIHNQLGIHSRGSGFAPSDTLYVLPNDTVELDATKRAQLVKEHQAVVDSLILTESALEFAFEGTRYYDIMRYALRQSNPEATMQKIIGIRKGEKYPETISPLANRNKWFLNWKGKVGM